MEREYIYISITGLQEDSIWRWTLWLRTFSKSETKCNMRSRTPDHTIYDYVSTFFWYICGSWHLIVAWELPYKVLGCFWQTWDIIQNEWYGNPRYVVLSICQIWCYWVDTFSNLAVILKGPKWFCKGGGEKVKVVQFGWFNSYQMQNFKKSQNIKVPCPGSCCAYHYTQNGVGDTRMGSGDHLWLDWFKLHLDWFFKEILNMKMEIVIPQRIIS